MRPVLRLNLPQQSYHRFQSFLHNTQSRIRFNNNTYTRFGRNTLIASSALIIAYNTHRYFSGHHNTVHAASAKTTSEVFCWGGNRYGQVGVGSETNEPLPTIVESLTGKNVRYISAGYEQTAVVTESGEVYTFGRGQDSRLGHGETGGVNETLPKLVEELGDKNVVQIDAGYFHMGCVTKDGELWTWGKNTYNQLGHSAGEYPNPVTQLKDLDINVVQVACGRYHTVVLDDKGSVYAWGGYKSGETGTGNKKNTPQPTKVSALDGKKVVQISAGQQFTLFLTAEGDVYGCGAGDQGQTGTGATKERYHVFPTKVPGLSKASRIAAGQFHSIVCTESGEVYSMGLNREGQCGHGDTQNRTTPSLIASLSDYKAIDVAAGGGHSAVLALSNEGQKKLFLFGRGRQGQIGRANKNESVAAYRAEPVEVDFFTNDVKSDTQQVALGSNHSVVLTNL